MEAVLDFLNAPFMDQISNPATIAVFCVVAILFGLNWFVFPPQNLPSHAYSLMSSLPGPTTLPFVGNVLQLKPWDGTYFLKKINEYCDKFDNVFIIWLGNRPMVVCNSAAATRDLIATTKNNSKASLYNYLHPWLETGLLTSDGEKWRQRRTLLTPAFHFEILKSFVDVYNQESQELVRVLKQRVQQNSQIDVFPLLCQAALDVICSAAMGVRVHALTQGNAEYVNAVKDASEIVWDRITSPWLYRDSVFWASPGGRNMRKCLKILHGFTNDVIRDRRELARSQTLPERRAFLDLLLENPELSDTDIREEVDTFMFEGHDTTSSGLSFTMWCLGKHPQDQERLRQEVLSVLGDKECPDYDDLKELKFMDNVLKESHRLFPPVPNISRRTAEGCVLDGVHVPAGIEATATPYCIHRKAEYYDNPNAFFPDRWDQPMKASFSNLVFSQGPRNCIGQRFAQQEQKTVLCHLLRHFEWSTTQTEEELKLLPQLIMKPGGGVHIGFKIRL